MEQLKEVFLPSVRPFISTRIEQRSKFIYLKPKIISFIILLFLLLLIYSLVISLQYQKAPINPAYNITTTLYFEMNDMGEQIVQAGDLISIGVYLLSFIKNISYETNCPGMNNPISAIIWGLVTNKYNGTGCFINLTMQMEIPKGANGLFYIVSTNGFVFSSRVYKNPQYDLVLITKGYVWKGEAYNYVTTPEFQLITGQTNTNVLIDSDNNQFLQLNFDFITVALFGLSSAGILWTIIDKGIDIIYSKRRGEIIYNAISSKDDILYLDV